MAFQLVQTKFYIPPAPSGRLLRTQLIAKINDCLRPECKLVLVSAPAGFGKSSLLGSWVESLVDGRTGAAPAPSIAWLSLDARDNDLLSFWSYLAAALSSALPGLGAGLSQALRSASVPLDLDWLQGQLVSLLNELASQSQSVIVILDDYHTISQVEIQQSLGFLLDYLPRQVRLVLSTRADPPLPLAPLRARGQLLEIRAADLRFSPVEAGQFLQEMGLRLPENDIHALENQTEGWIAGLKMAGLAVRSQADQSEAALSEFIQSFSGSHHFILDYLAEEVLNRQPAEIQEFLYCTSLLDRLCGPLCDEVVRNRDSSIRDSGSDLPNDESRIPNSEVLLHSLDRANLFLVPLDGQRRWYRYHHLFADLLQVRLRQNFADRIPELQRRSAAWFERQAGEQFAAGNLDVELIDAALRHALAARADAMAERIVARFWRIVIQYGGVSVSLRWFNTLPENLVRANPVLNVGFAWLLYLSGRPTEMEPYLDRAERAYAVLQANGTLPQDNVDIARFPTEIPVLRSVLARYKRDYPAAIEFARQARQAEPNMNPLLFGITALNMANAYHAQGDLEHAAPAYAEAYPNLIEGGNPLAAMTAVFYLTRIQMQQGKLAAAEKICRDLLSRPDGVGRNLPFGMIHVALADLLREQNRLPEAMEQLQAGIDLGRRTGYFETLKNSPVVLSRLRAANGDLEGAIEAIDDALREVRKTEDPVGKADLIAARARLLVRSGNLSEALRWAEGALTSGSSDRPEFAFEAQWIAYAYILLEAGRPEGVETALAGRAAAARTAGRVADTIEMDALLAIAFNLLGSTDLALTTLQKAIDLAEPAGYFRILADIGARLGNLIETGLARGWPSSLQLGAYAARLLDAIRLEHPRTQPEVERDSEPVVHVEAQNSASSSRPRQALDWPYESLSGREIEVLRLLAQGRSNREIARLLFLALGTVKTHIHNIYAKLGAENRVMAITRAREHELI